MCMVSAVILSYLFDTSVICFVFMHCKAHFYCNKVVLVNLDSSLALPL